MRAGRVALLAIAPLVALAGASAAQETEGGALVESMTLDEAIHRALVRDERARTADVQVAQAERGGARAATLYGPQASGFGNITFQPEQEFESSPGVISVVTPRPQYQVGGNLTQPLYTHEYWGRRAAARYTLQQTDAQRGRTREQVVIDTLTAYYEVLKTDRRVELAQAAVERSRAQVELAKARHGAGAALKTALLQAQIDLDRYSRQVLDAKGNQRVARDVLARLTGAGVGVRVSEPGAQEPGAPNVDEAIATAESARADLRAAQKSIEAAQADRDATKARLYPHLDGTGSYLHTNPTTIFQPDPNYWRVVVTLTVPLFQGGHEYLDVRDKESALTTAELTRDQLRKQIRNDVTRAWVAWEVARRQVDLLEEQRGFAQENFQLVTSQFKGGTATSTDVTVAQSTLTEAEVNLTIARYDREVAAAEVRFQSGSLGVAR
jgi:outer membrane protein